MSDFFTRLALRTIDISSPAHADRGSAALAPTAAIPESPAYGFEEGESVAPESESREEQIPHTGDLPPVPSVSTPATSELPAPSGNTAPAPIPETPAAAPSTIEPARHESIEPSLHEEQSVEHESMTQPADRRESTPRSAPSMPEAAMPPHSGIDHRDAPAPARPLDHPLPAAPSAAIPASIDPAPQHETIPALPGTLAPMGDRLDNAIDDGAIEGAPARYAEEPRVTDRLENDRSSNREMQEPLRTIAPATPASAMPHVAESAGAPETAEPRATESIRRVEPIHPSGPMHVEPLDAPEPESSVGRTRSFFKGLFSSRRAEPSRERGGDAPVKSRSGSSGDAEPARTHPSEQREPIAPSESFGMIRPSGPGVEPLDISIDDASSTESISDRASRHAGQSPTRTGGDGAQQRGAGESRGSSSDGSLTTRHGETSMRSASTPSGRGEGRIDPAKLPDDASHAMRSKSGGETGRMMGPGGVRPGVESSPEPARTETKGESSRGDGRREEMRRASVSPSSPAQPAERPVEQSSAMAKARSIEAGIAREIVKPLKAEAERLEGKLASETAARSYAERRREMPRPAAEPSAPERADVRPMSSQAQAAPAESAPAGRRESAPPPPAIRVSIGRVEVRAEAPPSAPPPRAASRPRGPAVSLSDYLKQRNRGH